MALRRKSTKCRPANRRTDARFPALRAVTSSRQAISASRPGSNRAASESEPLGPPDFMRHVLLVTVRTSLKRRRGSPRRRRCRSRARALPAGNGVDLEHDQSPAVEVGIRSTPAISAPIARAAARASRSASGSSRHGSARPPSDTLVRQSPGLACRRIAPSTRPRSTKTRESWPGCRTIR